MNFELSDDQQEIKRIARELLAARSSWEQVRAAAEAGAQLRNTDDALWRELCELGWPGTAVAEDQSGQGLGLVDLCVLLEELGYACAPVPLLGSALAALAIAEAGSEAQRDRWLPGLATGELRGALGEGAGELIPDAAGAEVVVLADTGGGTAALVDGVQPVAAIDPTRGYGRATGAGEPLAGAAEGALQRARVAVAAELVGICQRALDMSVAYVKERRQFGVPVGAFQAVQHRAAEMLLDTEKARAATYYAAWTADAEPASLPLAAAMAKASASDAGRSVTAGAIQLHGGIGFTWEADVHWLFKRAQLDSRFLGDGARQRARVAALLRARARG